MRKGGLLASIGLVMAISSLSAEKIIYVHGFSLIDSNEAIQDTVGPNKYWDPQLTGDVVFVGYDARINPLTAGPTTGSVRLLAMLNKYCRRDKGQSCRIISDSMGGLTTTYTIATYNAGNAYNILYSNQIVSAEGGSEIASLGDTAQDILKAVFGFAPFLDVSGIQALMPSYARAAFDHNRNNGTMFYHVAGFKSIFIADPFLPGKDDSLVAFHSSCSYRTTGEFTQCGGQAIRSCSWCIWEKKKMITPHTAHYLLRGMPVEGYDIAHADAHRDLSFHARPQ